MDETATGAQEGHPALSEDVDLDVDLRKRILGLHSELDGLDHYQVLGVVRDADKKAVKKAYYDLAARFHPDRYFRKRLGSFKARMEVIFARVTQAHDVLSDAEKRADYDAYLAEQRQSRSIEDLMVDALAQLRDAEEAIAREAKSDASPSAAVTIPAPRTPAPSTHMSTSPPSVAAVSSTPPPTEAARREALARKLLGGRAPLVATSSRPPPTPSQAPLTVPLPTMSAPSAAEAMGALRRRFEERVNLAKLAMTRRYVEAAEMALATGDVITAANSLRIAATLAPDDEALVERARQAQGKVDVVLAGTYLRQAEYEEKSGRWEDAARSWARVCKARPDDAASHDRAANAMLKADGDRTHEASRLAQQACLLDPQNAQYRVTLASVYQAAGLALNARRELETAAQLAPQDGTIQAMLKRAGKTA